MLILNVMVFHKDGTLLLIKSKCLGELNSPRMFFFNLWTDLFCVLSRPARMPLPTVKSMVASLQPILYEELSNILCTVKIYAHIFRNTWVSAK